MHRKHVDVSRNLARKKNGENNISSECHRTDGKWGGKKIEQYIVPHYRVNCPDGGHQINSFYVQHFHSSIYKVGGVGVGTFDRQNSKKKERKKKLNKDECMQG